MTADLSTAPGPTHGVGDTAGSLVAADAPSVVQSIDWLAIAPPTLTALAALIVLVADL
ncbi:NADH-quinone oxidoreductase subunit N, partial [Streptomyces sp. SID7499]|nr:NADH-quinone oxidoreductase subunit N [Streptomyces sp. SID7499]